MVEEDILRVVPETRVERKQTPSRFLTTPIYLRHVAGRGNGALAPSLV